MALDPMMAAFESEMRAKARPRPRPASTRRGAEIDNSSALGAAALARRIRAFWSDAGATVETEIIRCGGPHESPIYGIRSDMIGALPAARGDANGHGSLTVIGGFDPQTVEHLAAKLLAVTGDRGRIAEAMRGALPGAQLVSLRDYEIFAWSDVAAERTREFGAAMLQFLARVSPAAGGSVALREGAGEVAGISYRIRGAGPPLLLLPFFLAPSQWEPLVPLLSEQYCTITLGGAALGAVAILEARGRAVGYLQMVRTLLQEAQLHPGEAVLEVGCGTGVLDRWLARRTAKAHRVTGVDINPYLLQEASALARQEGLEGEIEFREGNAESLPFSDNTFDITMSVTVIEEVDADRMLAEMVRVTKPGGRVAVSARAVDMPSFMHLPLSMGLKAKVEAVTPPVLSSLRTVRWRINDDGHRRRLALPVKRNYRRCD
jgi:SAM-dependent methyltransferase